MDYMGEEYFKLKSTVIKYERFLLKVLDTYRLDVFNLLLHPSNFSFFRSWGSVFTSNILIR